jgi:hypothetical protein
MTITELKAEIFDILLTQDQHKAAIGQLEEQKKTKLDELGKLMQAQAAKKDSD